LKIIIVGPVFPYKGGIAHYTGLLALNLQKEHDVGFVSFSLQYPKLLYKKEQKDFDNDAFKFDDTAFMLNTVCPVSYIKTGRYIKKQNPDLVIFQWWHPFFAPAYWTILKCLGKKKTKVLFLCHNVLPHEKFPFQKQITKAVLKRGGHIVHSQSDAKDLESILKAPVYEKAVHPTYDLFSTIGNYGREEARERLSLFESDKVLLFFGFIREYKGLKHLIKAMPGIVESSPDYKLLIVGDYFEGNKDEYLSLIENSGVQEYIKNYDGYIPDNEVGLYFSACDVVVLPYESATQSGIVQIAYGFNKPVIATRVGGLPDVVVDDETGYLIPPFDSKAIADAVNRFFEEKDGIPFDTNIEAEMHKYSWDRMNETVDRLYGSL